MMLRINPTRRWLVLLTLSLSLAGPLTVPAQRLTESSARQQLGATSSGGTGLFTTLSPRVLRRGELTVGLQLSNLRRDPGAFSLTRLPLNLTLGLGRRLEGFVNLDAHQQVTVHQPIEVSGSAFSSALALRLAPEFFFGPAVTSQSSQAAARWTAATAPFGGILPALSSPLMPGARLLAGTNQAGFNQEAPFAPRTLLVSATTPQQDQVQATGRGMGNLTLGAKLNLVDPDRGRLGLALAGTVALPSARNLAALTQGRGTGEQDYGLYLIAGQEGRQQRLRFYEHLGYVRRGDPERNGVKLLDLRDEVRWSGGLSYAVTRHWESITELTGTVLVGGGTPNYRSSNPVDLQTGLRWHVAGSRVSVGAAYRYHLTRADARTVPILTMEAGAGANGALRPMTLGLPASTGRSFVFSLSFGRRAE